MAESASIACGCPDVNARDRRVIMAHRVFAMRIHALAGMLAPAAGTRARGCSLLSLNVGCFTHRCAAER
jgi:hypothetical protein